MSISFSASSHLHDTKAETLASIAKAILGKRGPGPFFVGDAERRKQFPYWSTEKYGWVSVEDKGNTVLIKWTSDKYTHSNLSAIPQFSAKFTHDGELIEYKEGYSDEYQATLWSSWGLGCCATVEHIRDRLQKVISALPH